jgi:hypothetical protein
VVLEEGWRMGWRRNRAGSAQIRMGWLGVGMEALRIGSGAMVGTGRQGGAVGRALSSHACLARSTASRNV